MLRVSIRPILTVACVFLAACGGLVADSAGEPPSPEATSRTPTEPGLPSLGPVQGPPSATPPGRDEPKSCNSLDQMGKAVSPTIEPGHIIAATGGTIVPGTYVKTAYVSSVPGSPSLLEPVTLQVTSTSLQFLFSHPGDPSYRRVSDRIVSVDGAEMDSIVDCSADPGDLGRRAGRLFTATPTTLSFYGDDASGQHSWHFDFVRVGP